MQLTATCAAAVAAFTFLANAAELRLTGPYTHNNLSIYLVHGPDRAQKTYLTLSEAIEQHKLVVYETSNVNQLQVENRSGEDVYIQSGEIVKGGKQDRVLKDDFIVPASSGKVDISAFCVEHGRWDRRGQESAAQFQAAPNAIATPAMKRAVKDSAQQTQVWAEVENAQAGLAANLAATVKSRASESSYQLTLEAPKVRETVAQFTKDLSGLAAKYSDSIGYVAAVNGKVTGADVYAGHDLFRRLWPKLLDSAVVEAIGAARPGLQFAAPPMTEVRAAATGYGARVTDERQLNRRTRALKADLPAGQVYETKDAAAPAAPVHRTYVAK